MEEFEVSRLVTDWKVAWKRVFFLEDRIASWVGQYSVGTSSVNVPFEEMMRALSCRAEAVREKQEC
jgi:hypothetical protein